MATVAVALGPLLYGGVVVASGGGGALHAVFSDDFYYYLAVVRHWDACGFVTYNCLEPTNGFHPAYLGLVALIHAIADGEFQVIAWLVLALAALSLAVSLVLARALVTALGAPAPIAAAAALTLVPLYAVSVRGMEAVLAVPAGLALCLAALWLARRPTALARLGFAAAGVVLFFSRLDSLVLIALLGLALALADLAERRARRIAAPAVVLASVVAYLAANVWLQGHPWPVSVAAKQAGAASPDLALFLAHFQPDAAWTRSVFVLLRDGAFCAIAVAVALQVLRPRGPAALGERAVVLAILAAPLLHLALLAWRGTGVWHWYYYLAVIALPVAAWAILIALPSLGRHGRALHLAALAAVVAVWVHQSHRAAAWVSGPAGRDQLSVGYHFASALARHMERHPGTYALGDMAGMAGYLGPAPIVQLEGLVMDYGFVERIAGGQSLETVFRDYGVDHYATVGGTFREERGCVHLAEPRLFRTSGVQMRATLCGLARHDLTGPDGTVVGHVFALAPANRLRTAETGR